MSILTLLERFVSSRDAGAIVLQGPWGVGKTFFWRTKIIAPYLDKPWRKKYSYVSVFGIGSLAALKAAIYQATKEFDYDLRRKWWRFFSPRWLWWKAQRLLPSALSSADIPHVGRGASRSFDELSFYFVRSRLICFDDIERKSSGLSLRDIFGLISYLADEKNCRVVVILNSDALEDSDKSIWDVEKEKVFIGEVTFSPSIEELIDLGLGGHENESWYPSVRDSLRALKVSNIRIVQRVVRFMDIAMGAASGRNLETDTVESISRVVSLLTFSKYGRAQGAPPMDFVLKSNPFDLALRSEEAVPEQEKKWMELIGEYHIYLDDPIDHVLGGMISDGYLQEDKFRTAIDEFEGDVERKRSRAAYEAAWRVYHDFVEDNGQQFADAMQAAWPRVSAMENVYNLEAVVKLMRLLGRGEIATRFIQEWVSQREGDRVEELSDSELGIFRMPTDLELLTAIAKGRAQHQGAVMPLIEALGAMADEGVKERAVEAIAAATPGEIAEILIANPGPSLVRSIRRTLELGQNQNRPAWAIASSNMEAAAKNLAARSPLNADRMRNWFRIEPN